MNSQTMIEIAAQIVRHVVENGRVGDDRMPAAEWNERLRNEVEFEAEELGLSNATELGGIAVEEFGRKS